MKKLVMCLCVAMMAGMLLFASDPSSTPSGTVTIDDGEKVGGQSVTTNVTLDLSANSDQNTIVIGFAKDVSSLSSTASDSTADSGDGTVSTSSPAIPSGDVVTTSYSLVLNDNGTVEMGDDLYVFWYIQSGAKFSINLAASGALQIDPDEASSEDGNDANDKIEWEITWDSKTESTGATVKKQLGEADGNGTYSTSKLVYDRDSATSYGDFGYSELSIVTESVNNKTPGNYSGTLTLSVISSGE